jgi:hypothetical protein
MTKRPPTFEEADVLLRYEPETGKFFWRVDRTCGRGRTQAKAGDVAGTLDVQVGYWRISVNYCRCHAHRLAWLLTHRHYPQGDIDHINGVRSDNRLDNLRDVPHRANLQNRRAASVGSKSGLLGVAPVPSGRWRAAIGMPQGNRYIGTYDTPEEAHGAYVAAKRKLHEGCTL